MRKYIVRYTVRHNKFCVFTTEDYDNWDERSYRIVRFKDVKQTISPYDVTNDSFKDSKKEAICDFYKRRDKDFNFDGEVFKRYICRFCPEELL